MRRFAFILGVLAALLLAPRASADVAVASTTQKLPATSATSETITIASIAANTVVVLFTHNGNSTTCTCTSSNLTWTQRLSSSTEGTFVCTAPSSGALSNETVTVTCNSAAYNTIFATVFTGADSSSLAHTGTQASYSGTNPTITQTLTHSAGKSYLLGMFTSFNQKTLTANAGTTKLFDADETHQGNHYGLFRNTTVGTGSTTLSVTSSVNDSCYFSWMEIGSAPSANVTLTTVSATGAVGNVSSSGAAARTLASLSATGAVGTVTSSGAAARTLGSVSATGAVGTVSSSGAAVRTLGTVSATGGVGNVSAGGAAARTLTTVSATGAVGSMTSAGNNAVATLTRVAATGAVGALSSSGAGVATLVGVAASGALGGAFSALGGAVATLTAVAATGWVGVVHAVSYKPPYPLQLELARPAFKLGTPPALLEVELVLPSLRLWLK